MSCLLCCVGILSGLNKPLIVCDFFPEFANASSSSPRPEMSARQAFYAGVLTSDILVGGVIGAFGK